MEFVTFLGNYTIRMKLDPPPTTRINTCDYGGQIHIIFIKEGVAKIIPFTQILENASPDGGICVHNHCFDGKTITRLESICWRVLYRKYGIFPAVFQSKEERDIFFSSQEGAKEMTSQQ